MNTLDFRSLKAFGNLVQLEATRDLGSARDLKVLRDIETTLDTLDVRCALVQQVNLAADHFIKLLNESDLPFNENDVDLVPLFEKARDSVGVAYEQFSKKHLCAVNAPELVEEDGVVDAYALLLTEIASLHEKLNTLAWLIREQEADQDVEIEGRFEDVDDLFASMGV